MLCPKISLKFGLSFKLQKGAKTSEVLFDHRPITFFFRAILLTNVYHLYRRQIDKALTYNIEQENPHRRNFTNKISQYKSVQSAVNLKTNDCYAHVN